MRKELIDSVIGKRLCISSAVNEWDPHFGEEFDFTFNEDGIVYHYYDEKSMIVKWSDIEFEDNAELKGFISEMNRISSLQDPAEFENIDSVNNVIIKFIVYIYTNGCIDFIKYAIDSWNDDSLGVNVEIYIDDEDFLIYNGCLEKVDEWI